MHTCATGSGIHGTRRRVDTHDARTQRRCSHCASFCRQPTRRARYHTTACRMRAPLESPSPSRVAPATRFTHCSVLLVFSPRCFTSLQSFLISIFCVFPRRADEIGKLTTIMLPLSLHDMRSPSMTISLLRRAEICAKHLFHTNSLNNESIR